ncbi:MAG TPA: hypothetical protein VF678_12040, partial [bacterium]
MKLTVPEITHEKITLALCAASGPLCVFLVQRHSVVFWQQHALGWWTGLLWSAALELISLLFWWQPWYGWRHLSWRYVGAAITLVLLLGPMYELSAPLFAGQASRSSRAESKARLTKEYNDCMALTQEGRNFGPCIARTSGQLSALEAQERGEAGAKQPGETAPVQTWQDVAVIVMECVSVVAFYLAIVLVITTVSGAFRVAPKQPKQAPETPPVTLPETPETTGVAQKEKLGVPDNPSAIPENPQKGHLDAPNDAETIDEPEDAPAS